MNMILKIMQPIKICQNSSGKFLITLTKIINGKEYTTCRIFDKIIGFSTSKSSNSDNLYIIEILFISINKEDQIVEVLNVLEEDTNKIKEELLDLITKTLENL